eukprot:scaffold799_cov18-Tisochrysis_lutea.AAC.2
MRAVVCAASSSVLSAKIGSFIWRTCPLRKTRKEARAAVYAAFTSFLPESKRLPALDVCRGRQETRRELQSAPHLLRFCPLETPSGCLLPGADLSWKLVRTLMPARGCGRCLCCGKGPCASIVHMVAFTHVLVAARAHMFCVCVCQTLTLCASYCSGRTMTRCISMNSAHDAALGSVVHRQCKA